jgi:hypothetical protein
MRYTSSLCLPIVAMVFFVPAIALAVDGVILIDQNKAMAGNVTPGDAPGFPATISQSGSYRLSGNLTVPNADTTAIQIITDNVTLDLNGFTIKGPTVCTSTTISGPVTSCSPTGLGLGIIARGADSLFLLDNITILNGTIRGMGSNGIFVGRASRIEKCSRFGELLLAAGNQEGSSRFSVCFQVYVG